MRPEGGRRQGRGAGVLPLTPQGRLLIQELQVGEVMKRYQGAASLLAADPGLGQLRAHLVGLPGRQAKRTVCIEGDGAVEGGEELVTPTGATENPGQSCTGAEEAGAAKKAAPADRLSPSDYQGFLPPPTYAGVLGILAAERAAVKERPRPAGSLTASAAHS